MPVEYEFDIVDCPIRFYGEVLEDEFRAVLIPASGIERFDNSVASVIRDAVSVEFRENELNFRYSVSRDNSPPIVFIEGEFVDSLTTIQVGNIIGRGVARAEEEIDESNRIDNAELNAGFASVLEMYESEYFDETAY